MLEAADLGDGGGAGEEAAAGGGCTEVMVIPGRCEASNYGAQLRT